MVHSSFYYPKKGGLNLLLIDCLEGLDISTNTEINNIKEMKISN